MARPYRLRLRAAVFGPTLALALVACVAGAMGAAIAAGPPKSPADTTAKSDSTAKKSLLPLAQPLWSDLSASQRQILDPFGPQWNALPVQQKRLWLALADRFPKMKPDEQQKARERIREWAALTPDQRRLARQNFRLANTLPNDQRVAQWEQYQSMTPEQRAVLQSNGSTSNTAAKHAGARTGLAKEAAQPISDAVKPVSSRNPPAAVPAAPARSQ